MQYSGLNIIDDSVEDAPPLPTESLPNSPPLTSKNKERTSRDDSLQEYDDEYTQVNKKRRLDDAREERLRLLELREREEEDQRGIEFKDGKDEEVELIDEQNPPSEITTLMRHTLKSLTSSPNPQILELRIMTHHASDPRFSFLKTNGRYSAYWQSLKGGPEKKVEQGTKLGGLMGMYAGSDSGSETGDDSDGEGVREPSGSPPPGPPQSPPPLPDEEPPSPIMSE